MEIRGNFIDPYGWNYAARPEGAEALSPGHRPGFVGVSLAPCKGKSLKKHLIKNENSLRYVKLLPLQVGCSKSINFPTRFFAPKYKLIHTKSTC